MILTSLFPRWNCISRTNIPLPSGSAILALPWKNHVCAMCIHVCIYLMDTGLRRHGSWRGGASGSGIVDTQSQAPGLNTTSPVSFWRQFNDIVSRQISSQWWRLSVNRNQILSVQRCSQISERSIRQYPHRIANPGPGLNTQFPVLFWRLLIESQQTSSQWLRLSVIRH